MLLEQIVIMTNGARTNAFITNIVKTNFVQTNAETETILGKSVGRTNAFWNKNC